MSTMSTLSFFKRFISSSPSNPVTLNTISNNPGAYTKKLRVGRGPGSGLGKSAGRGMCGQKAREGGRRTNIFEGQNIPITRTIPKFGFNNKLFERTNYTTLNLNKLSNAIKNGCLPKDKVIDIKTLHHSNLCGRITTGIKILGNGADKWDLKGINLIVSNVSASAKQVIEANGGTVKTVYYNSLGLRAHLKPEKFDRLVRNAAPVLGREKRYDIPQPFPAAPPRTFKVKVPRVVASLNDAQSTNAPSTNVVQKL